MLPPGTRCTGFWYSTAHGFPADPGWLAELESRAARIGRGAGYPDIRAAEGGRLVLTWDEQVWGAASADMAVFYGRLPSSPYSADYPARAAAAAAVHLDGR